MAKDLGSLAEAIKRDTLALHRRKCLVCRSRALMANVARFKVALAKDPERWQLVTLAALFRWAEGPKHGISYHSFRKHLMKADPELLAALYGG